MTLVLVAALIFRTFMDICFKYSVHHLQFTSVKTLWPNLLQMLKNGWLWAALSFAFLNFWLWSLVLSHFDLSFAYPLFSICYVWIMIAGKFLFNEHLDRNKLIGMILILISSGLLIF